MYRIMKKSKKDASVKSPAKKLAPKKAPPKEAPPKEAPPKKTPRRFPMRWKNLPWCKNCTDHSFMECNTYRRVYAGSYPGEYTLPCSPSDEQADWV